MILASNSPQRKILFRKITDNFEQIVSNTEEVFNDKISVYENVMNIAHSKADAVRLSHSVKNNIILGADTVCFLDNKIIGKPKNYNDAFDMIKSYNNKKQEVITGVSLIFDNGEFIKNYKFYDVSYVTFYNLTDIAIKNWLAKNEFLDKAGAYAIQQSNNYFDVKIDGSLENIIGLPTEKLIRVLSEF